MKDQKKDSKPSGRKTKPPGARIPRNKAEEPFKTFFDYAPFGKAITSPDGKFLLVNPAFCDMLGYTKQELENFSFQDITHPDDMAESLRIQRSLISGENEHASQEKRYLAKDGHWVWINMTTRLLRGKKGKPLHFLTHVYDITASKQQQEALRESEENYRNLFENAQIGMFRSRLDGSSFLAVNERFAEIFGYTKQEFTGFPSTKVWADPLAREQMVETLKKRGKLVDYEVHVKRKNGEKRIVLLSLTLYSVQGIIEGSCKDITENRRMENALRENMERFRLAAESATDLIWEWDIDAGVVTWFGAVDALLGYGQGKFPRTLAAWEEILHPDDHDRVMDALHKHLADGFPYSVEYRVRRKDGSLVFWTEKGIATEPEKGGNRKMVGVCTDITERKKAEEALQVERDNLHAIMSSAPVALLVLDADARVVQANRAAERLFNKSAAELRQGRCGDYLGCIHRQEGPDGCGSSIHCCSCVLNKAIRDVLAGQPGILDREVEAMVDTSAGPASRWFTASVEPLVFDGQRRAVAALLDITGRKQAEEAREKIQAQLVQAQKMESVGRLAGGVAHDFNNMLGVIIGHTEMALDQVDPALTLYADLEEIKKSAQRSADLTRQLLAFARKQLMAPRVLNLNETVEGMLQMLSRLLGEGIELLWAPGPDLWPVRMDPAQIDQILADLLVNAQDAIGSVGNVTLRTENSTFDAAYCGEHPGFEPGDFVTLSVSDDGCGMDKEVLDHLFEPFFTTKGLGRGTGLGLATVYGIVKQNRGFINVRSAPGQGSVFNIHLPRSSQEAPQKPAMRKEKARGSQELVLLVEDEAAILKMARTMLEQTGYKVLTAGAPDEALLLAQANAGKIDLLITDVIMPHMNGQELARRIQEIQSGLKCLFMSGYTADIMASQGIMEPGMFFIQKPFSFSEFLAKVRQALGKPVGGS